MPTNSEGPGAGSAGRHEVEGPRVTDALYAPFKNEPTPVGIDPADGLPRPVVSQVWKDAQAPELDPERFVCMADCSAFVRRDSWGASYVQFEPSEVERAPDGRWRVTIATFATKMQPHMGQIRKKMEQLKGRTLTELSDETICVLAYKRHMDGGYIAVEPLRPKCSHYARQLVPFPEERERTLAIRLCTARRTDEGEFLDLGNQQMLACSLRLPVFGNNEAEIDAFDERTIAAQRETRDAEVADDFELDAALGAQASGTTKGP